MNRYVFAIPLLAFIAFAIVAALFPIPDSLSGCADAVRAGLC